MQGPVSAYLPGNRLHLHHGPIDLIVGADGERDAAFDAAKSRFDTVLEELVDELPLLRAPITPGKMAQGPVAARMCIAAAPFAPLEVISPMIAVAGAVADEILDAMTSAAQLTRAYVNNGGDIALHLEDGARFEIVMAGDLGQAFGRAAVTADDHARGMATSGTRGRSLSLGIADSVTAVGKDAASADAAATLISNAIDLPDHPGISRETATDIDPDSDLGDRLVVTRVPRLTQAESREALDAGIFRTQTMLAAGQIDGAALFLQGEAATFGKQFTLPQGPEAADV